MSLKSTTFTKLSEAVSSADTQTVIGVQILALAASAVKNLNEGTDIEEDVYQIGIAGELGFGQATCPEHLIPDGWRGLEGHDNIISKNYGNYIDTNGSILVYVPKHYYKIDGNSVSISHNKKSGHVIDRTFINAGIEKSGTFVYKYGGSNSGGIFSSKQGLVPLSTSASNNPISSLSNAPANNMGGIYKAVKTAGDKYHPTSVFEFTMLARLALAHGKAAQNQSACAFIDIDPKMPKGCNNNALADTNDSSVVFATSGYSNCALTGSGSPFAKTTHNGQDCGIADLNGNMWELASGFIRMDTEGFLVLKESVDIASIATDASSAGGAYDVTLYDVLDISDLVSGNDAWIYLGNGANQVFDMSTDRASDAFKRTSIGIPLAAGVSASGTTEFGNDGVYRYLRNEMACLRGGHWYDSSAAGVGAVYLYYARTASAYTFGARASYLV